MGSLCFLYVDDEPVVAVRNVTATHYHRFTKDSSAQRDTDVAVLSVRLSVCLSVTRWICAETTDRSSRNQHWDSRFLIHRGF